MLEARFPVGELANADARELERRAVGELGLAQQDRLQSGVAGELHAREELAPLAFGTCAK